MFQPPCLSPPPATAVTVDQAARALAQAEADLAEVRQMGAVARAAYREAAAGSDPYTTTLARDRVDGAEILIGRAHAAVGAAERALREAQERECAFSPAAPQASAGVRSEGRRRGR